MSIWRSMIPNVTVHESGWTKLPSGVYVTKLPLWDESEGLFAQLSSHACSAFCASKGWEMCTVADYQEIHKVGTHVEPSVLPTARMLADAGVSASNAAAIQKFREREMRSQEWAIEHTNTVFEKLKAAGWDGSTVVDGAGKHFTPDGIFGWYTVHARQFGVHNDEMIQTLSTFHNAERGMRADNQDGYGDYATLMHARCTMNPAVSLATATGQLGAA